MPRNNRTSLKDAAKTARTEQMTVGIAPAVVTPPNTAFTKNLQDALIDGLNDPGQWAVDFLGVEPYPQQRAFLRATRDCSEANLSAGNRSGKTHVAGITLGWRAFYRYISPFTRPDLQTPHNIYKAVATSMTLDQAKLSWSYCLTFMQNSKRFRPFLEDYIFSPFPTIKLRTKNEKGEWVPSEIWARSLAKGGLYLLGHSINFILIDECAFIAKYPQIENEVIRMRLADTGGSIFRYSSPNGRNFFYSYYGEGLKKDTRYYSQQVTSWDNPYISRAYLEQQKEKMLPEYYAQNIMAEFVSLSDFFKIENIQALYDDVEETGDDAVPFGAEPREGHQYVLGVDLGAMRDPTVVYINDITPRPAHIVAVVTVQNGSWASARALANQMYHKYRPVRSTIDATGAGNPVYQQLIDEDGWENTEGFVFSQSTKVALLSKLQDSVQRGAFRFPFRRETQDLVTQLSFYRLDDRDISQDHVMALALANWSFDAATKATRAFDTEIDPDLNFLVSRGNTVPNALLTDDERRCGTDDIRAGANGQLFLIDDDGHFYPYGGGWNGSF